VAFPIAKATAGTSLQTGIERLKGSKAVDLETEKQRLRKVTKEYESLFMYEMLKTMRKTIPKDSMSKDASFSNGLGKDTFEQMFDMELARKMAGGGQGSISSVLYKSLEPVVEAQYKSKSSSVTIGPLNRTKIQPEPLIRTRKHISLPQSHRILIRRGPKEPIPIRSSATKRSPGAQDAILLRYGRYIDEAARQFSLDSVLIYAVIKAESNGNPRAVSPAGAKGLMQLADSTVRAYCVNRVFDPRENILTGSRYLKDLLDRFGELRLALAAYNAGPQNVERYGGVPPFAETRAYIEKVADIVTMRNHTLQAHDAKVPAESIR